LVAAVAAVRLGQMARVIMVAAQALAAAQVGLATRVLAAQAAQQLARANQVILAARERN
jgi:hypothetical protein